MKSIFLIFITSLFFCHLSTAQRFEIGLGFGNSISNVDFHHTSKVTIDNNSGIQTYGNSNFNIYVISPIAKANWYLRSELGFLKLNSHYNIRYTYDEGYGALNTFSFGYLATQKMYLSITPEHRKKLGSTVLKFSGGPVFTSDLSNEMITANISYLPKSSPPGFRMDAGLQYNFKNVGFEVNLSYMRIAQSVLQNIWHPRISYHLMIFNLGVVYSINTAQNEKNVKE